MSKVWREQIGVSGDGRETEAGAGKENDEARRGVQGQKTRSETGEFGGMRSHDR